MQFSSNVFMRLGNRPAEFYLVPALHWKVLNKTCASSHCLFLRKWKNYYLPTPPVSKRELKEEEEMSERRLGLKSAAQKSPWPEVQSSSGTRAGTAKTSTTSLSTRPHLASCTVAIHLRDH